jgi:hypothetical protein
MQQALAGPRGLRARPAGREGAVARPSAHCGRRRRAGPPARASAATREDSAHSLDAEKRDIQQMLNRPYKYGFQTFIDSETFPKGLDEDVVRAISAKKAEPEWMLEFRLKAFRKWLTMEPPAWSDNEHPAIDFQDLSYYSQPKMKEKKASLDEVDPELLRTFDKLGIPLNEQKRLANVAVDAVFDSVSIATTFREELAKAGVIFCSISEAVKEYPDLVKKYLGSVVRGACGGWRAAVAAAGGGGAGWSNPGQRARPAAAGGGGSGAPLAPAHPRSAPLPPAPSLPRPPTPPGARRRQLLRRAQQRGVQRRLVRVCAQGREEPHGAVDLLPHQRVGDGPGARGRW